jgi:branched-chain amino acid transport system substrate-binding protein
MKRPTALWVIVVALTVSTGGTVASAQQALKIGLILPLTGPFTSTGHQIEAAAKLYMQQNSDTIAGKKVQLLVKDDGGVADTTKRLAQELIVREKVAVLAGFGLTPLALATAPLATRAPGID